MIPPESLRLRTLDAGFSFQVSGATAGLWYEVYHAQLGDVIHSGFLSQQVPTVKDLERASSMLYTKASSAFSGVKSRHEAIKAIGGFSAFDADLILDSWEFDEEGMRHPLCGGFQDTPGSSFVGQVNSILEHCAPPTTWFWVEDGVGEVRVKCILVPGADSYNVYDGVDFLANVPNSNWQSVSLSPGTYSALNMAAVIDGQVGIPSFHLQAVSMGAAVPTMTADGITFTEEVTGETKRFRSLFEWLLFKK